MFKSKTGVESLGNGRTETTENQQNWVKTWIQLNNSSSISTSKHKHTYTVVRWICNIKVKDTVPILTIKIILKINRVYLFTIYHLLRLDRPDGLLPISTSVTRSDLLTVPHSYLTQPEAVFRHKVKKDGRNEYR